MNLVDIFEDLKKWFTYCPLYKIIALILAIVVYLYVNGEFK
ncbi:MAG: hypothetical protein V1840_05985 [Candidatus Omnitrophota bacterium]